MRVDIYALNKYLKSKLRKCQKSKISKNNLKRIKTNNIQNSIKDYLIILGIIGFIILLI